MIDEETVASAEVLLGHQFASKILLEQALTHSSAAASRQQSNERLEFLGDAILDLIICEELFLRHPDLQEGELTTMKSSIVSRRTCGMIARSTGLADLLVVGKGVTNRRSIPNSLAAAVYESVVAALYLDAGIDVVRPYVLRTMADFISEAGESEHAHNYKAMLQQHAQRALDASPTYELLDEKGPDHSKCFEVGVSIDGRTYDPAWGTNKKSAEQKAAVKALHLLKVLDDAERDLALDALDETPPSPA